MAAQSRRFRRAPSTPRSLRRDITPATLPKTVFLPSTLGPIAPDPDQAPVVAATAEEAQRGLRPW